MMDSALFHYRRRVERADGEVEYNDNFISPLQVISMFWSTNKQGNRVLAVFLTNQYSQTFPEATGKAFQEHMERFLRSFIGMRQIGAATPRSDTRRNRVPIPVEGDIEENQPTAAEGWES